MGWDWIAITGLALTAIGTALAWLTYRHDRRKKQTSTDGSDASAVPAPTVDGPASCSQCALATDVSGDHRRETAGSEPGTSTGMTGRMVVCPRCGATVVLPGGTEIRVEGSDAREVSKVTRGLLSDATRKRRGRSPT